VGLFLAAYLRSVAPNASIVLLESGDRIATTEANSKSADSTGKPHNGTLLGRATGLGGTSSLWGGQLAEFEDADFSRRDSPWPFGLSEMRKYYSAVYRLLGIYELPSDDICRLQLGGEGMGPETVERFFTHWLRTPNFARYFKPILQSKEVRCYLNTTAIGMEFDGSHGTAIKCRTRDGKEVRVAGTKFIFSTGTIPTVRFFLTTQNFDNVPWKANQKIGGFFQDHFGGIVGTAEILDEALFREYFENGIIGGHKVQPKLRFIRSQREKMDSGACIFFGFDSSVATNLGNIKTFVKSLRSGLTFSSETSILKDIAVVGRSLLPIVLRFVRDRRILAMMDRGVSVLVQAEQIPIPHSRITLAGTDRCADGLLKLAVDWNVDGGELVAVRKITLETDNYLQKKGLARLRIDPRLLNLDPEFFEALSDTYHQCGGMRMSTAAEEGVVDPNCRVWGTSNLWVVGAAVFPSSSHANCTLTALALAARLGDRLVAA
jgi:choline dehydrogenase-like flavoprotein